MISAVVYQSNTGFTRRYAEHLAAALSLPVVPHEQAKKQLAKGTEVIFCSHLIAEKLQSYIQAAKNYNIQAVMIVCLAPDEPETRARLYKNNHMPPELPCFILPGGLDYEHLSGKHKLMLKMFAKMVQNPTQAAASGANFSADMIQVLKNGGDLSDMSKLQPLIDWYKQQ